MKYWLVKSEPTNYSWDQLVQDKSTVWDGVRNYQARNNLREMNTGDRVLVYHSNKDMAVVGIAKVTRPSFQDPTTQDDRWLAVEIAAVKPLSVPVTLADIKDDVTLQQMLLVKNSRLSVMPVSEKEYKRMLELAGTK